MADNLSIEDHPDFGPFFQRARDEVWGEFAPRYTAAVERGNADAAARIQARVDEHARRRTVVALRALQQIESGEGPLARQVEQQLQRFRTDAAQANATLPTPSGHLSPLPGHGQAMAITRDDIAANADEILRELQRTGIDYSSSPGGRARPIDIISALEANPRLTLADVLPPEEPQPQPLTLSGDPPRPAPPLASVGANVSAPGPDQVATLTGNENQPPMNRPPDRRQQFIDAFGVDPDAPDFQSQVWSNFASQAAPQVIGTALGPVGGLIGRAAQAAPRLTTAALGGIGSMLMPGRTGNAEAQGRPPPREEVMELQRDLQRRGYYRGPIDGRMEGGTATANENFQRDEQARRQQEIEAARAQAEQGRAQAETEAARARQQEAQQQREADQRRARERDAGNKRMQEMEQNVCPLSRFVRDYGEPLGYLGGAVLGMFSRGAAVSGSNAWSRFKTSRADQMISEAGRARGPEAVSRRVGAVNQFWAEGQPRPLTGPRPQGPFEVTPEAPLGFRANPAGAQPASALYQPPGSVMGNTWTDAGVAGSFMGESVASMYMASRAHTERDAAQAAVERDPTEANIQRLQAARDNVAFWDGMVALGRTGAGMHLGLGAKFARSPSRPDVARAEAMQMSLGQRLGNQPPPPRQFGPRPPEGAQWNEALGRWQVNGTIVGGRDRWAPPE